MARGWGPRGAYIVCATTSKRIPSQGMHLLRKWTVQTLDKPRCIFPVLKNPIHPPIWTSAIYPDILVVKMSVGYKPVFHFSSPTLIPGLPHIKFSPPDSILFHEAIWCQPLAFRNSTCRLNSSGLLYRGEVVIIAVVTDGTLYRRPLLITRYWWLAELNSKRISPP